MIKVTMELISAISPTRNKVLGVAYISNQAVTTAQTNGHYGDYKVELSKREPKLNETWRRGEVHKFPRKRLGAWDLLYRALKACCGERNDP